MMTGVKSYQNMKQNLLLQFDFCATAQYADYELSKIKEQPGTKRYDVKEWATHFVYWVNQKIQRLKLERLIS